MTDKYNEEFETACKKHNLPLTYLNKWWFLMGVMDNASGVSKNQEAASPLYGDGWDCSEKEGKVLTAE